MMLYVSQCPHKDHKEKGMDEREVEAGRHKEKYDCGMVEIKKYGCGWKDKYQLRKKGNTGVETITFERPNNIDTTLKCFLRQDRMILHNLL